MATDLCIHDRYAETCGLCTHGLCIHDLDPAWCSLCKHGLARPLPPSAVVMATFRAKYDGQCNSCNLPISVGQMIQRMGDDRYIHEGCE